MGRELQSTKPINENGADAESAFFRLRNGIPPNESESFDMDGAIRDIVI